MQFNRIEINFTILVMNKPKITKYNNHENI